jgi:hypothetical protein
MMLFQQVLEGLDRMLDIIRDYDVETARPTAALRRTVHGSRFLATCGAYVPMGEMPLLRS